MSPGAGFAGRLQAAAPSAGPQAISERLAQAISAMRRPEIRLHPADVGRFAEALAPTMLESEHERQRAEMFSAFAALAPIASVPVVPFEGVERGHVWLVDREPPEYGFAAPTPVDPSVFEWLDALRSRMHT